MGSSYSLCAQFLELWIGLSVVEAGLKVRHQAHKEGEAERLFVINFQLVAPRRPETSSDQSQYQTAQPSELFLNFN